MFSISVITPVYNAERFLPKTIESVLMQPEVQELILIDDGSNDNSLELCRFYAAKDKRVKVLYHANHVNKGRSATRNLGIENAKSEFIAFIDADDFFMENRFARDVEILRENLDIDGVYNAIGVHFYDDFEGDKNTFDVLTTLKEHVEPENLFELMGPIGDKGCFSGDGFTVRRLAFEKVGLFEESLKVAEDTHLWIRMALKLRLVGGLINKPVSSRGVHGKNIAGNINEYNKMRTLMYQSLYHWALINDVSGRRKSILWYKWFKSIQKDASINSMPMFPFIIKSTLFVVKSLCRYPFLIKHLLKWSILFLFLKNKEKVLMS